MINRGSILWQYLSKEQRVLAGDGEFLVTDSEVHKSEEPTDYSYLVFPFAKMFEGFLKQFFLDMGFISEHDYYSNHFRIGRALSPNLVKRLGHQSIYGQAAKRFGQDWALRLWHTWKECRNLVFHYFPHNYRALTRTQAIDCINEIIESMDEAVTVSHVRPHPPKDDVCYLGKS
jgi:hypothetical protein